MRRAELPAAAHRADDRTHGRAASSKMYPCPLRLPDAAGRTAWDQEAQFFGQQLANADRFRFVPLSLFQPFCREPAETGVKAARLGGWLPADVGEEPGGILQHGVEPEAQSFGGGNQQATAGHRPGDGAVQGTSEASSARTVKMERAT